MAKELKLKLAPSLVVTFTAEAPSGEQMYRMKQMKKKKKKRRDRFFCSSEIELEWV